ncbi:cytochrome P450 [Mycena vulgaris]|nr:cytochrome P450 [Mycena vulgaris]
MDRNIFRSTNHDTLTPEKKLRLATMLTGSGMSAGTSLIWLAALLAAHPEMQKKAYRAIEEVYGGETPDPLDTDRVEYIKALGMEAGRYFTSIRLGFPRETHEDFVVDVMFISKGVLIEFVPERWMDGHYGRTDIKQPNVGVPHLDHGAGRRMCMGVINVNKIFYANLVLLLHFFKLERGPLGDAARAAVFPKLRGVGEASLEVHSIDGQVSACDPQALPLAAGIKLTAPDPNALSRWLTQGHRELGQWDRPNPTNATWPSEGVDPDIRGHY